MAQSPEKIFTSLDFTSLSEKSLILLIKRDDLQMNEIEVREHILKWEFSQKVRPYQKLLDQQLYEELLNSYLEPGSVSKYNVLRPRIIKNNEIKVDDSQIIDSEVLIQKLELYLPYKLLKGSRDGITPKKFHELCDGKPKTVTFIKVKGNEEILSGHNPLKWETTDEWCYSKDSFIFSFNNKNIRDTILNNVIIAHRALDYSTFGRTYCKKRCYERIIRGTEEDFSIEDYEVFKS
ncbi:hypothetical protein C1646_769142 [Rhizophagus diaphanus]|nr:hypothetical protein C1646_769142 [Rhizophagus diaphanus] [Rhizophagus sp. MUCL 43196]